jgi:hypothetical protein
MDAAPVVEFSAINTLSPKRLHGFVSLFILNLFIGSAAYLESGFPVQL